jgi:hypothetical protein
VNIFFDVDETILGYDGSLRPHTRAVFERLIADGHTVYIWSGVGIRSADVQRVGLQSLVTGIYQKPLSDFANGLQRFGVPVVPDFVVDDYPQIVEYFGGLWVDSYLRNQPDDVELLAIPDLVAALALTRSLPSHEAAE